MSPMAGPPPLDDHTAPDDPADVALPCSKSACGAKAGQPCISWATGRPLGTTHVDRRARPDSPPDRPRPTRGTNP